VLGVLLLLKMRGRMVLSSLFLILIIAVEVYFLYLSISIYISY
jgi:hypothetical protein